jgi:hypothetical protein
VFSFAGIIGQFLSITQWSDGVVEWWSNGKIKGKIGRILFPTLQHSKTPLLQYSIKIKFNYINHDILGVGYE